MRKLPLKPGYLVHRANELVSRHRTALYMLGVGGGGLAFYLRQHWDAVSDAWDRFTASAGELLPFGHHAGQEGLSEALSPHTGDIMAEMAPHGDAALHAAEETMHHASPEIIAESASLLGKLGLFLAEHWHDFLPI